MSPAAISPRMWLEETISPSASHELHDARRERVLLQQQRDVAARLVAEAEVLPHADALRAEPVEQDVVDELLRRLGGEGPVERDHHELADAEPGDQLGLDLERGDQLGRRVRRHDRARVRLEREHGVGVAHDRAVPEMDAVELAHGDMTGPALGVGEPGDVH